MDRIVRRLVFAAALAFLRTANLGAFPAALTGKPVRPSAKTPAALAKIKSLPAASRFAKPKSRAKALPKQIPASSGPTASLVNDPALRHVPIEVRLRDAFDGGKLRPEFKSGEPVSFNLPGSLEGLDIYVRRRPISVQKDLPKMIKSGLSKFLARHQDPRAQAHHVEIAPLAEIPRTYIAVFGSRRTMNLALDRASTYVEFGGITAHDQHIAGDLLRRIAGHDLTGPQLTTFWKAFEKAGKRLAPPKINPEDLRIESDFWQRFLLPRLKREPDLVLLGVYTGGDIVGNYSHELLHAQFFTNPLFQKTVRDFWKAEISARDKTAIRKTLAPSYNVKDRFLVLNEFQAYLLEPNAKKKHMADFVDKYAGPLARALAGAGIEPMRFAFEWSGHP